jgi:hypothetical protein
MLVGSALILAGYIIPIVPLIFVSGYILRIMRQAIEGQEVALPEWDDWGELTVDGLKAMVVYFTYFLPALIAFVVGFGAYIGSFLYLPMKAAMGTATPEEAAMSVGTAMMGGMAAMFGGMLIGSLLAFLAAIAVPVAMAHFVADGRLRAAFHIREWLRILFADKLGYLIAWVIIAGLFAIVYTAMTLTYYTVVLCCLAPLIAAPLSLYVSLLGAALFGQVYRSSAASMASAEDENTLAAESGPITPEDAELPLAEAPAELDPGGGPDQIADD